MRLASGAPGAFPHLSAFLAQSSAPVAAPAPAQAPAPAPAPALAAVPAPAPAPASVAPRAGKGAAKEPRPPREPSSDEGEEAQGGPSPAVATDYRSVYVHGGCIHATPTGELVKATDVITYVNGRHYNYSKQVSTCIITRRA